MKQNPTNPFTTQDAINGLKHAADDHSCCAPFLNAVITLLEQKPKPGFMSQRWTKSQQAKAWAIVNDIAEDIDNKESRAELRQALAIYADYLTDAYQTTINQKSDKLLAALKDLGRILDKNKTAKK